MDQENEKKQRRRNTRSLIDVQSMIVDAEPGQLRSFLRVEAKRNKVLAIKLKTKLIESYTVAQGVDKYRALLGEIIREGVDGTVKLSKRDIRLFNEICVDLLVLSAKYHSKNEHRENHNLLHALASYLHRYLDKIDEPPDFLIETLAEVYTAILKLLQYDIAPELRDDIVTTGLETLSRSYHTLHDPALNMASVLLQSINDPEYYPVILVELREKSMNSAQRILWATWYSIFAAHSKQPLDLIGLNTALTSRQIFQVAQKLLSLEYSDAFRNWLISFEGLSHLDRGRTVRWNIWQLEEAFASGDDKKAAHHGYLLLTSTNEHQYFDRLTSVMDANTIFANLKTDGYYNLICDILVSQQEWDKLSEILIESHSWNLLLQYVKFIAVHGKDPMAVIWPITTTFIEGHVGSACLNGLQLLFENITATGQSALIDSLDIALDEAFPGRFKAAGKRLNFSY